jgi:hypothetical protein
MTTLKEELLKIMKDKDFALINIRCLINFIEEGIEEIEDREIQLRFDELQDLFDKKANEILKREIEK